MTGLSTNSVHRVIATATHDSLISGADATASTQAILDVLQSVRIRDAAPMSAPVKRLESSRPRGPSTLVISLVA